jgi:hypothetical protein
MRTHWRGYQADDGSIAASEKGMVLNASQDLSSLHVVIVHVLLPMNPPTWSLAAATKCMQSL